MSVNLDKEPDLTNDYIQELGVKHVLLRFKLSDIDKIDKYIQFVKSLKVKSILLNVIQDPYNITDKHKIEKDFKLVFKKFTPYVKQFQIGSTINRSKWGFFSVNQYLKFYETAYGVKEKEDYKIKLLGPSVIDFEYHYVIHALFNFFTLRYDMISALLYVDRRGAPENKQLGLDLVGKIHLLYTLATLSPKSSNDIVITETNWPISNTAPYAPTSEHECVDEESYANYMVRYYLLAFSSCMVKTVYWHQLIAPGYGLIDNRNAKIHKRRAYKAFKTMIKELEHSKVVSFVKHKEFYEIIAERNGELIQILWCNAKEYRLNFSTKVQIISRDGERSIDNSVLLSDSPIYIKELNEK